MENGIKMFLRSFDIDVESLSINALMEFTEIKNDLGIKAKFLSKSLLEFYEKCLSKTRFSMV